MARKASTSKTAATTVAARSPANYLLDTSAPRTEAVVDCTNVRGVWPVTVNVKAFTVEEYRQFLWAEYNGNTAGLHSIINIGVEMDRLGIDIVINLRGKRSYLATESIRRLITYHMRKA